MSRQFNFRAWDNVENKMIYLGEDNDYSFEVTSTGFRCTKLGTNPFDYEILEHLNYQQYTGLKDRNGKDIFEGDILSAVRYGTNIPAGVNRWTVYYNEERLTYYWINQEGVKEPFWEFNLGAVQYIIIGNIFENPELLEEKHE